MLKKEELEESYLTQGLTMKQVAEKYDVAVGTVYNYIKKYGIESRPAITEETKAKISKTLKGRPSSRKGCKATDETRKRMSEARKAMFKDRISSYGGHRKKHTDGYICVYCPYHPHASKDGYVMEHILIMEKHIGRFLKEGEVVHHKNHIRDDNRIENLALMTFEEHARLHAKERWESGKMQIRVRKVKNVDTGEIFNSAVEAGIAYNVNCKAIRKACREKTKSKGCYWKYI